MNHDTPAYPFPGDEAILSLIAGYKAGVSFDIIAGALPCRPQTIKGALGRLQRAGKVELVTTGKLLMWKAKQPDDQKKRINKDINTHYQIKSQSALDEEAKTLSQFDYRIYQFIKKEQVTTIKRIIHYMKEPCHTWQGIYMAVRYATSRLIKRGMIARTLVQDEAVWHLTSVVREDAIRRRLKTAVVGLDGKPLSPIQQAVRSLVMGRKSFSRRDLNELHNQYHPGALNACLYRLEQRGLITAIEGPDECNQLRYSWTPERRVIRIEDRRRQQHGDTMSRDSA